MRARIIRRIAAGTVLVMAGVVGYLCLWPVPADPRSWSAPTPPGYVGAHRANERLAGLRKIDIGKEFGPEHIAMGPDGKLYAAMTSGSLLRMEPDGGNHEVFANTGGRVLGFAFNAQGDMIAADAMKGLLTVTPDKRVTVLTDRVSTQDPIRYANSVVVAPDGTIYFTDASARFAPKDWGGTYEASVLDILEQAATGRVLAYDPRSKSTRIVAHGFSFANGIAVSADGQSLFVAETGRYRIWKIDAKSDDVDIRSDSTKARVLLDNLPGYPDNLMRGREGRIWVGLFRPRNPAADDAASKPFLRKVLLRLPRALLPVGQPYGHVFAINEQGDVLEDLQDPTGAYPETTGATEVGDRLYIHSLHATVIGWLPRPSEGAEEIYILRSIREPHSAQAGWCALARTGFPPIAADPERLFSFWSVKTDPANGRMIDAHQAQVAELRACFGATDDRARQNFYAEIQLAGMSFHGKGECLALLTDFPQPRLFPVRCQLVLGGLRTPYVGGTLTTNTLSSGAAFGGQSDPPGYTQASIATIRLWRQPASP